MQKAFLESEHKIRITKAEDQKNIMKYHDKVFETGDEVLYQNGKDKGWYGPVKILRQVSTTEVELDMPDSYGELKHVHKCRVARYYHEIETKKDQEDSEPRVVVEVVEDNEDQGIITRSRSKVQFSAEDQVKTFNVDFMKKPHIMKKMKQEVLTLTS